MHIDLQGLIVQADGDAGDSLQRASSFGLMTTTRIAELDWRAQPQWKGQVKPWPEAQKLYCVSPGIYVRHPDKTKWYSDPDTTTRDQLITVIMALGARRMWKELLELEWAIVKRWFFAQNIYKNGDTSPDRKKKVPDTFIGHINVMLRAWGEYALPFYPIILLWDFFTLIGQGISLLPWHMEDGGKIRKKSMDDVDDNNGINQHIQALAFLPTPLSWLSRKIYSKFRQVNLGNTEMGEGSPVMGALVWYHRKESGGNPEMAELYRPVVRKYFI